MASVDDALLSADDQIEAAALDLETLADARRAVRRVAAVSRSIEPGTLLHARALLVLGIALNRAGLGSRACATLVEAVHAYGAQGDIAGRARALDALGTALGWCGDIEQAMLHHALALADWALLGDRGEMSRTLEYMGRLNLEGRRHAHALEFFHRAADLLEPARETTQRLRAEHFMAQTLAGLGRLAEAMSRLQAAVAAARDIGYQYLQFVAARDAAQVAHRLGDATGADRYLADARRCLPDDDDAYEAVSLRIVEAGIALDRGEKPSVTALEHDVDWFANRGLAAPELEARLLLARALVAERRPRKAERHLSAALRKALSRGLVEQAAEVRAAMGRLDLADGILEEECRPVTSKASENLSGYVLRESLGSGGFGSVTRAYDLSRARDVALKELHLSGVYAPAKRARILASARVELEAAARVQHPGIARIHALNRLDDDRLLLVEEFIPGRTLRARMTADAWPAPREVLDVMLACVHALEALHSAGVVHRDVKPGNIVMRTESAPVLIDFGLAQLRGQSLPPGTIVGTPAYMAPEQASGGDVDARADLYSVGVILHEWLAGSHPIPMTGQPAEDMRALRERDPEPLGTLRPDLPGELCDVVSRLLQKRRARRPASASELAKLLAGLAIH